MNAKQLAVMATAMLGALAGTAQAKEICTQAEHDKSFALVNGLFNQQKFYMDNATGDLYVSDEIWDAFNFREKNSFILVLECAGENRTELDNLVFRSAESGKVIGTWHGRHLSVP